MGLFDLPAFRKLPNLLLFLLRATLLETKPVMNFLHFVASLRFKSRFLPFLVNRALYRNRKQPHLNQSFRINLRDFS